MHYNLFQGTLGTLKLVTDMVNKLEAAAANAAWQLPFVTLSPATGATQNITPVPASASARAICRFYNECSKLKCVTFLSEQVNGSENCTPRLESQPLSPLDGGIVKQNTPQSEVNGYKTISSLLGSHTFHVGSTLSGRTNIRHVFSLFSLQGFIVFIQ